MAVHAGISSFFIIIKKGSMPAFLSTAILPLVTTPSFILPVYSAVSAVSLPYGMILLATNPFGISALACAFTAAGLKSLNFYLFGYIISRVFAFCNILGPIVTCVSVKLLWKKTNK